MNSSTSNSESVRKRAVNWLILFGCVLTALIVALTTVNYFYASRPQVVEATEERQLTAYKIFAPERFDLVASGSSRINFGIDPRSMQPFLPGLRIYNCAMFGGSVNREIMDFLEARKIDWNSAAPRIVLIELSPRVMWTWLRGNKSYRSMINKPPDEIRQLLNYSPKRRLSFHNLFIPMDRDRWNQRRDRPRASIPHCHVESGWYEVVNISEDCEKSIPHYLRKFNECPDMARYNIEKSLAEILEKTRDWSSRGVMVFGVEPPIDRRIKEAEERVSGYDADHIHELFREAGGIFIPIRGTYRAALGGSHMESEEAKAFSREVAQASAAEYERRTGTPLRARRD